MTVVRRRARRVATVVLVLLLTGAAGCSGPEPSPAESEPVDEGPIPRAEVLAQLAESNGLEDVPDVPVVREATSFTEKMSLYADCLTEAGYPATLYPDGSVGLTPPEGPAEKDYNLANYTCEASYPMEERFLVPYGDTQWGAVYDHYVQTFLPCAQGLGYEYTAEVPTRETFIATSPTAFAPLEEIRLQVDADTGPGLRWETQADFEQECGSTPDDEDMFPPVD